jgi:hypothetical protein
MSRQFKDHIAQQRFERNLQRLDMELNASTPRRHLDVLVELLELLVGGMPATLLAAANRQKLNAIKTRVATRPNLRLVPPS